MVTGLCQMLGPILAFTSDEAWEFIPGKAAESVHAATWQPATFARSEAEISAANEALDASDGDVLLVVADSPGTSASVLGEVRRRLGHRLGRVEPGANELVWIVDWPLMEWTEAEGRFAWNWAKSIWSDSLA